MNAHQRKKEQERERQRQGWMEALKAIEREADTEMFRAYFGPKELKNAR